MWHSHLNDMEIPETKRFTPEGFELGLLVRFDPSIVIVKQSSIVSQIVSSMCNNTV